MKVNKIVLAILLFTLILSVTSTVYATDIDVGVKLNDQEVKCNLKIINGRVMMPLLRLADLFKLNVTWYPDGKNVVIKNGEDKTVFNLDNNEVIFNGHSIFLDVSMRYMDGRYYIPLRFIAEKLGYKVVWDESKQRVSLKEVFQNNVRIVAVREEIENDNMIINIQYPQVQGLKEDEIENKINTIFEQHAHKFKKDMLSELKTIMDMDEVNEGLFMKYYIGVDYRITYNQKGYLNIVFVNSIYSGGAHGMAFMNSYLLDLKSGKILEIKDIFKENEDYVDILSRKIKKIMDEKDITSYLLTPFECIKTNQDYYIKDDSMIIYFQIYEYTPYAAGFPEFCIVLKDIKDMLKLAF